MFRNIRITFKFFLFFFITNAIAIISMMVVIYLGMQDSIVNANIQRLATIHEIKVKKLKDTINTLENPLLYFIASNSDAYQFNHLSNLFYSFDDKIDPKLIDTMSKELVSYFNKKYKNNSVLDFMHVTPDEALASTKSGIVTQYISIKDISKDSKILELPVIQEYLSIDRQLKEQLDNIIKIDGVANILFISKDDDVIYSPVKNSSIGHNVISSNWMKGLSSQISMFHNMHKSDEQEYFVVDVFPYAPIYGSPVFFIATPMFDEHGYKGSIVLILLSDFIDSIISNNGKWEEEGLGKTGDVYVTSSSGMLRSNMRQFATNKDYYLKLMKEKNDARNHYDMVEYLSTTAYYSSVLRHLSDDSLNGKVGHEISKTIDGKDIVTYYAPVHLGNLTWIVFVRMELSEIYADVYAIRNLIIKLLIPVLLTLFTIIAVFSYLMTRPIKKLKASCLNIASGDLDFITIDSSYKEINDLIDSFNKMVENLLAHEKETQDTKRELEESINQHAITSKELRVEKDFITKILNAEGLAILVIDENDTIVRANNAFKSYMPNTDVIGMNYKNILPEEYKKRIVTLISQLRYGVEAPYLVTKFKFEQELYIEWNFSLITEHNEEINSSVSYIVAIGINVTDRYKAQKSLQENEAMVQRIFSNAYDAILIADDENNILMVNKSFELLFEYDFMEIVGQPVINTIFGIEYEAVILSDVNEGQTIEIEAMRSDKSKFPIDLSISKIVYRGKTSILYILRDASLRKKRERDLRMALERARTAEKAKGEFLANMSHEIRTPLNGIMGFLDLLKETSLDNTQNEYLKIISSSSDSLFSIINDILDFSKIESGKLVLENIDFNIWDVFEDSVAIYSAKAVDKNIILMSLFNSDLPKTFIGDPLRIRQIITNLISNAIKFTDEGGRVLLRVSLSSINETRCKVRISVKDNGIGVAKEQQKNIMEAFSQADSSVTRKYGGTGLGLTISNSLVKAMKSSMQLSSELGKGSEFYFTLDLPVAGVQPDNLALDFKSLKLVSYVAKRQNSTCDLYEEYLNSLNVPVFYADSIELIEEEKHVDIIFINFEDYSLEEIQNVVDKFSTISVVCYSSKTNTKDIFNIKGDNYYPLIPPLSITKLIDIVDATKKHDVSRKISPAKSKSIKVEGNVLLVDDNEVNSKLSGILLKNMGANVDFAENGQVAVEKAVANKYDLILMDIFMPIMDGISATKEIISNERLENKPHTPIVALTANVMEDDIKSFIMAGMDDFLAKPIVKNKLEAVLVKYLNKHIKPQKNVPVLENFANIFNTYDEDYLRDIINDFCSMAWHYTQVLTEAANDYNEGSVIYIVDKILIPAEQFNLHNIVAAIAKIKTTITEGIDEEIFKHIDELKSCIFKLKISIGYMSQEF